MGLISDIASDPQYIQALAFAQTYNPNENTDYAWVIEHASKEYERFDAIAKELDAKANSLIGYSGVLGTAVSVVFTYNFIQERDARIFYALPALLFMLLSIVCAAKARMPEVAALPLSTQQLFRYADSFSQPVARASSAAMTHAASIWTKLVNEQRGRLIRLSIWLLIAAFSWLVLSLCIIGTA